jgi:hypothetical protein
MENKKGNGKLSQILGSVAISTTLVVCGLGVLRSYDEANNRIVNNYDHAKPAIYHVQSGDTLDKIAIKVRDQTGLNLDYRLVRDEILEINNSNSEAFRKGYLIAGEDLKVPSYKKSN